MPMLSNVDVRDLDMCTSTIITHSNETNCASYNVLNALLLILKMRVHAFTQRCSYKFPFN